MMMANLHWFAIVVVGLATLPAPSLAGAHPQRSLYTSFALSQCTAVVPTATLAGKLAGAWKCDGLPGWPLFISVREERTYFSAGPGVEPRRAAAQSLASVNSPVDPRSGRITVEWRFVERFGVTKPYAMIVRYFTRSERGRGEVLVVSRVDERQSCHVAYVDALANSDAMVLARGAADKVARSFDCTGEPRSIGRASKSPM